MRYYFHFPVFCAVALFALPFSPTDATAGESNAEAAKRIYDWAQSLENSFTFTASLQSTDGNITVFKQANPDGTLYSKSIYPNKYGSTIYLNNMDGNYEIVGKTAIKNAYKDNSIDTRKIDYSSYDIYSLSEGTHQSIPCYVVKKATPDNPVTFSRFLASLSDAEKQGMTESQLKSSMRTRFLRTVCPITVLHIGKENGFIYARRIYDTGGKLLLDYIYDNVEFSDSLPRDTFDLPDDAGIIVATNLQENIDASYEALSNLVYEHRGRRSAALASDGGIWVRVLNWFKRNFDIIAYVATWFFVAFGVLSLVALVYIKSKGAPFTLLANHHKKRRL